MIIKDHTRIDLAQGGTRFKQGDFVELAFTPRDAAGKVVDLTGKQIEASIWNRSKGVIYQGAASWDSAAQLIRVTIKETLDHGKFQIEFTVTDSTDADYRRKFPSDEYNGVINITPSTDNMDVVGVQMTTVSQLRAEQAQLQDEFAGQVLPRVDTVEGKQAQLEADYQAAAGALTEDSEVILARKGEPTLRAFNDKVVAQLADIAINPKSFGAIGDGIADDTQAIQNAFNAAANRTLNLGDNDTYRITSRITMPSKTHVTGSGKFICDGDQDFWFFSSYPTSIVWEVANAEVIKDISLRTKLNRVIRCEYPVYFEVKTATIIGATTAIHSFFGDDFVCGDIYLYKIKNWEGLDGGEGYGVVSSSKRFSLRQLYWENESPTEGRHPIYINGNQWEKVNIGSVFVKNCNVFPISIIHSGVVKALLTIDSATFINCNLGSSASSNGCINGGDENGNNLTVKIGKVIAENTGGPAVSFQGNEDHVSIDEIIVRNLPPATHPNSHVVNIRNGRFIKIGAVDIDALNDDWISGVYFRDVASAYINFLKVLGLKGSQALRNSASNVEVGTVISNIQKIFRSGGSFNHTAPLNKVEYSGAPPTTGAYIRGDIVYANSPSAGGFVGWICVTTGTPGTWKGFGSIQA